MIEKLQRIESVLSRYRLHQSEADTGNSLDDIRRFSSVISKYQELEPTLREIDMCDAGHFNLFEIMKVNYYEALVHTPVLCNLLDPRGSHSQGDLFYRSFIETVFEGDDRDRFSRVDDRRIKVQDELFTRYGSIDIFIQHQGVSNPYILIIENKILAGDQEKQLARYYEYVKSLSGFDDSNIRMLYLKPFGSNPSVTSLDSVTLDRLSKNGVFKIISYEKHVLQWLQGCTNDIKAPVVKYTVLQYIDTLKTICR